MFMPLPVSMIIIMASCEVEGKGETVMEQKKLTAKFAIVGTCFQSIADGRDKKCLTHAIMNGPTIEPRGSEDAVAIASSPAKACSSVSFRVIRSALWIEQKKSSSGTSGIGEASSKNHNHMLLTTHSNTEDTMISLHKFHSISLSTPSSSHPLPSATLLSCVQPVF